MPIYVILAFFLTLSIAIAAFGYHHYARPGRVFEQLGEPVIESPSIGALEDQGRKVREYKILQKVGAMFPSSPADTSMTRRMLSYAGYRADNAVHVFLGIKLLATFGLGLLGLVFRNSLGENPALHIIFPVGCALGGYIGPSFILGKKIKKRQEILRLSLPDALDLLVIAVEAGLGLDQAMQYVSTELRISHKELTEELSLVTLEIRAGKRRGDALKNLGERTGEPELRKLVAILIQNARFGTSIADSLRNHSDFLRVRRRQEAEERAAKVGVKLVFPIFFCILPAMMMVCAGPGVLQVVKYMLPLMRGAV